MLLLLLTLLVTFHKKEYIFCKAKIYRQFQLVSFVIYKQPTFECNTNSSFQELVADFWPYFSGSSIWKFLAWCTMSDPSCYKCFIRHRVVFYSKHASEHEFTMNLPPSGILIAISCKLRFLGERANSSANFVKLITRMSKDSLHCFWYDKIIIFKSVSNLLCLVFFDNVSSSDLFWLILALDIKTNEIDWQFNTI